MPKRKRLTPQEKKAISLERDRRNAYGLNRGAVRRIIALRKAQANRVVRRTARAALRVFGQDDSGAIYGLRLRSRWKKWPDASLRDHIDASREKRKTLHGRKKRNAARRHLDM